MSRISRIRIYSGGGAALFNAAWAKGANDLLEDSSMKKNVAGQSIGVQMITASDGSAFTGGTTIYITLDNGTQTIGTVGSGICAHEGNGYHSYAPAQAETNGDHMAATFIGTGAIPVTVQLFTGFPQTVDNATNISAVKTVTDALPDSGALTSLATAAALATVDTVVDGIATDTGAILTDTGTTIPAQISGLNDPTAASIADAVWDEAIADHLGAGSTGSSLNAAGSSGDPWATTLPGAYGSGTAGKIVGDNIDAPISTVDTVVDGIATDTAAILVDTGTTIPAQISGLNDIAATDIVSAGPITTLSGAVVNVDLVDTTTTNTDMVAAAPTATENADALLNRDMSAVSDTTDRSPLNALRFLRNKYSVTGTTLTVTKENDTTAAWTSVLTTDATADPVTGSDPT